jgi:hypothetical protein
MGPAKTGLLSATVNNHSTFDADLRLGRQEMGKRLQVPAELEHLIEKREADERREGDQRSGHRRGDDLGPLGAIESTPDLRDVPTDERRVGDRRQNKNRRARRRRKSD